MADISALGTSIKDFQVGQFLGKGGFASVYRAVYIPREMEVAIKMIDKRNMREFGMIKKVKDEARIHYQLKHPSILELYNCFEDDNYVYLVLEFCRHGELGKYLQRHNKSTLSEPEACYIIRQVLEGLIYLHSHGILHRDLTLSNLLLNEDNHVKIGDFGLATKLNTPSETHMTMCGTPNYISPEVATKTPHGTPVDVWGLGVLLYTLLIGRPPFETPAIRATLNKVVQEDVYIPHTVSFEAEDLLRKLLEKDQCRRISANEVSYHSFMRKYPDSPLLCSLDQDSGLGLTCSACPCSRLENTRSRNTSNYSGGRSIKSQGESNSRSIVRSIPGSCCESDHSEDFRNSRHRLVDPRSCDLDRLKSLSRSTSYRSISSAANSYSRNTDLVISSNHLNKGDAGMDCYQFDPTIHGPLGCVSTFLPSRPVSTGPNKPPRISTTRLQEKRVAAQNAIYYILRCGDVVMENVSRDRVVRRLRVTGDGNEIFVEDVNESIRDKPPDITDNGLHYYYDDLPQDLWKRYGKLGEFVKMIQSYTYKISLGTRMAACFLMESSPDDFTAHFYSGLNIKKHGENVTVTKVGNLGKTYKFEKLLEECKDVQPDSLRHFIECFRQCLDLERLILAKSCGTDLFPASFGTYRSVAKKSQTPKPTVNNKPERAESTPVKPKILHKENDGRKSKNRRRLEKTFPDGNTLTLDIETGELKVEDVNGTVTCFSVRDPHIPLSLVEKLRVLRGQVSEVSSTNGR